MHAETLARAFVEGGHVTREFLVAGGHGAVVAEEGGCFRVVHESVCDEGVGGGKEEFMMVHAVCAHGDRCAGWDDVVTVGDGFLGDAWGASYFAVGETEGCNVVS